jgi:predicted metal-dependent phosphoesterase TrpH
VLTDLHCHSTASDGDLGPPDLVVAAAEAGVGTLALTDHDTMEGVPAAVAAGEVHGVRVVPGIELTVRVPAGSMHLLGYFSAAAPRPLVDRLTGVAAFRERRVRRIVERLAELGMTLDWNDVRGRAAGQLGRPHVAAAMVDAGHVATLEDAFDRWLADGRPAHVPPQGLQPEAAVRVVRESGGVPVLAHPASLALPARHLASFVQRLAAFGLVGIEVHRPEHRPEQRDAYAAIARRLRLVPSGGSDFHRPDGPFGLGDTGHPGLPEDTLNHLFDRIDAPMPGAGLPVPGD